VKLYVIGVAIAALAIGLPLVFGSASRPAPITMFVYGRVFSVGGNPIKGAEVQAALGLDQAGVVVRTDQAGHFNAIASAAFWFKGPPYLRVSADGYVEQWLHFEQWEAGSRTFHRRVLLQPVARAGQP